MSSVSFNPYTALSRPAGTEGVKPQPTAESNGPVASGVSEFKAAIEAAEKTATGAAISGADPHAMVEALANAELALDTAVTVRDKLVEAYQELLRMPV